MENKERLLVSFSGGRTSAYMTWWLMNEWKERDNWEITVVFANTGKERIETLEFINNCDHIFGFRTVWIEGVVNPDFGKGTSFKIVDFESADRTGGPFENVIAKYGIPNKKYPHCTRELKGVPIKAYARSIGWDDYYTAIGIRSDEFDRMSENKKALKYIYPLIQWNPIVKSHVNSFWSNQPFDLQLKSYEGNCDFCWKKSLRKHLTLISENPFIADWWENQETKYENYTPVTRSEQNTPYRFFRNNLSVAEIKQLALRPFKKAKDESKIITYRQLSLDEEMDMPSGCTESCEPFV